MKTNQKHTSEHSSQSHKPNRNTEKIKHRLQKVFLGVTTGIATVASAGGLIFMFIKSHHKDSLTDKIKKLFHNHKLIKLK